VRDQPVTVVAQQAASDAVERNHRLEPRIDVPQDLFEEDALSEGIHHVEQPFQLGFPTCNGVGEQREFLPQRRQRVAGIDWREFGRRGGPEGPDPRRVVLDMSLQKFVIHDTDSLRPRPRLSVQVWLSCGYRPHSAAGAAQNTVRFALTIVRQCGQTATRPRRGSVDVKLTRTRSSRTTKME